MQLRNKITEVRSIKFTSLLFETQSTKHSGSQFGGRGRNGKNNSVGKPFNSLYMVHLFGAVGTQSYIDYPVYTKNVAPSAGFQL